MPFLFDNHDMNRHMPYIFEGDKLIYSKAGFEDLYYEFQTPSGTPWAETRTAFRPYKLYVADLNLETGKAENETPIGSNRENNDVYCSPSAYRNGFGEVVLTYTREGVERTGANYYMAYKRRGDELTSLSNYRPIKNTMGMKPYCLAENRTYRVVAKVMKNRAFVVVFNKQTLDEYKVGIGGISFLRRISFVSGTNKLLLTFPTGSGHFLNDKTTHNTHLWDLETDEIKKIVSTDTSLYKCSIFGDTIIYAYRDIENEGYWMDLKIEKFKTRPSKLRLNEKYRFNRGTAQFS